MKLVSKMLSFTLVRDGKDGEDGKEGKPGKPGPVIYNGGEWDKSKTYTGDSTSRPYVKYKGEYYYLKSLEAPVGVPPSEDVAQNKGNWGLMEKFNPIITEAIFSDFANLGSFIMQGDYLMSQHGKDKEGNYSTNYKDFPDNFIPTFQVNGKTGDTIMNNTVINNATLNDVYARGTIASQMSTYNIEKNDREIDFDRGYVSYLKHARKDEIKDRLDVYYMLPKKVKQKHVNTQMTFVWETPYIVHYALTNVPLLFPVDFYGMELNIRIGGNNMEPSPNNELYNAGGVVTNLSVFVGNSSIPSKDPDEYVPVNYIINSIDRQQFNSLQIKNGVCHLEGNRFVLNQYNSGEYIIPKGIIDSFPINDIFFIGDKNKYIIESKLSTRHIALTSLYNDMSIKIKNSFSTLSSGTSRRIIKMDKEWVFV